MSRLLKGLMGLLIVLLLVVGLPWASCAFIGWAPNPGDWSAPLRAFMLFWVLVMAATIILIAIGADD